MRLLKILSSIILFSLFFLAGSCKHASEPPPPIPPAEPLIPLAAGNYWLYLGYILDPDSGFVRSADPWQFGFMIQDLPTQMTAYQDQSVFRMTLCGDDLRLIDDTNISLYGGSKLVFQDQTGFHYMGIVRKDTLAMSFSDSIFPSLAQEGDSAKGHIFYYSNLGNYAQVPDEVTAQYVCISRDSLFTTGIGSFRCIVYRLPYYDVYPLFRDEVYYFIKPGLGIVGMVEMGYFYKSSKYKYFSRIELTNYKTK